MSPIDEKISEIAPLVGGAILSDVLPLTHLGTTYGVTLGQVATAIHQAGAQFDAREYGVVADGITDDSNAVQDAEDAAVAAGGGTVLYPPGHIYCASTITWKPGVSHKGAGSRNTFLNLAGSPGLTTSGLLDYVTVSGLCFDHTGVPGANNVDMVDIKYGLSRSAWDALFLTDGVATRYPFRIRTKNPDTSAENNTYFNRFSFHWNNSGSEVPYPAFFVDADGSNFGFNSNRFDGGIPSGFATGFYIQGQGNVFTAVNVEPVSVAGYHFYDPNGITSDNVLIGCYFDGDWSSGTGVKIILESVGSSVVRMVNVIGPTNYVYNEPYSLSYSGSNADNILVAVSGPQGYTAGPTGSRIGLTQRLYANNISLIVSTGDYFIHVLTENATLDDYSESSQPTPQGMGRTITVALVQAASGGPYEVSSGNLINLNAGFHMPTAASSAVIVVLVWNGSAWYQSNNTPGGLNTQVQFNDGGLLAGDASFAWDKTTKKLTVGGDIQVGGLGDTERVIYLGAAHPSVMWQIDSYSATFSGVRDDVLNIGFNTNPRSDTTKAGTSFQIENDYYTGGIHTSEFFFQWIAPDGSAVIRPMVQAVEWGTKTAYTTFYSDSVTFYSSAGAFEGKIEAAMFNIAQTSSYGIGGNIILRSDEPTNIFMGYRAGYVNNAAGGGVSNVFIGSQTGLANTTGPNNVFLGDRAGHANSTGARNLFIGDTAGYQSNGNDNVAIGSAAFQSSATGNSNIAIGASALLLSNGSSSSVAIGSYAGYSVGSGEGVYIGGYAGFLNTGGQGVMLGHNAGFNETAALRLYISTNAGSNEADGRLKALLYGIFSATPANQALTTNASLSVTPQFTSAGINTVLTLDTQGSGVNGDGGSVLMNGKSSTTSAQAMGLDQWLWVDATHASRKARRVLNIYDTAVREVLRIEASGSAAMIGFLGANAAIQQTGGAATAGLVYTATEQAMIQKAYDCLRTFGLLS